MFANPAHFKGERNPVEQVRWSDAAEFCNARSRNDGLDPCYDEVTFECNFNANGYRLPTEAEWEYASRAGSQADYPFGGDPRKLRTYAHYSENAGNRTLPVGTLKPNAWGLFDMLGNVAEWCQDRYAEGYYQASPAQDPRGPAEGANRVLRGGAWNSRADACRVTYRSFDNPGITDACFAKDVYGFRCVRNLNEAERAELASQADGQ